MILRTPRISARKQNILIREFALNHTAVSAAYTAKVSRPCANRWYRHFREVIYQSKTRAPRMSGDVEIDQAFFSGRGKKKETALVRQLAGLTRKQILRRAKKIESKKKTEVVCFFNRGGGVYTHIVGKSDVGTMVPLIRLVVEPKSTIYTDKWPAFNALKKDGYKHYAINHSHEYKDRRGRHINGVDRFVSFSKGRLNMFFGIPRSTFPLHLKECEWRWNLGSEDRGTTAPERVNCIIKALKALLKGSVPA